MSFWQRLFGGGAPQPSGPLVVIHELIPGELSVRITRHDLALAGGGAIPCWTYTTQGLAAAPGQREIALSLRILDGEKQAPRDPLPLFEQLYRLAKQGRTVGEGDYTCFRAPGGFLGTTEQTGLAYIAAVALPGVEVPPGAIAAILLTPEEAEIVPVIGPYRVTALLGKAARYYPCPPWSERGRPSVLTRDDMDRSILRKVPLAVYPGATVTMQMPPQSPQDAGSEMLATAGARVTLRLPLPQPDGFRDALSAMPDEWSLALLTHADPKADVRLVWRPGQGGPELIGPAGAGGVATGGFVLLAAGGDMPAGAKVLEDGFGVMLPPALAAEARRALINAGPLLIDGEGGLYQLALEWIPSDTPERRPSAFDVQRTILYQAEEVMRERVASVEAMSRYLRRVMDVSDEYWSTVERGEGRPVLLTFALKPGGRVRFWVDSQPALEPLLAGPWLDLLDGVPPPDVRGGPVALALEAMLWRTAATPWQWPYMPAEWQAACAGRALLVPDGVLEVVWPG